MIKHLLLGTFCLAQFSFAYAKEVPSDSKVHPAITSSTLQKVPKTVIIKTKKFKIRIDKQPNGKYLYQSWNANAKITAKPSMIISDGELIPDGTGGNYYIQFSNEGHTYQIWRNYLTDSAKKAPYTLTVSDSNDQEIVRQDGYVVKN
ncbi:hypothetical protein C1637_06270 [Chryseobacterium lactis]|uniref:Bulb-type lectin domain-containing protein n=1 Tax=Chryseobacterium lactis TaxID=1241981 RepID=A0A3G6RIM6_CHRLC|nr:hypothetical protein [Chryseobacterium lactis]AZA84443.1 hypothetical protein EG342_22240 [Chryseobacterium lactis]AZB04831.1 hypothetical protein EG341_13120 [Chryseobacterium lactis]PNW14562.1 hypothetical protein C1637_06270 [Chryseobacterium lactis]